MKNQQVADLLYEIADLLDIKGEIFFKTRAYRMAAQKIEVLDEDIEKIVEEEKLKDIPGIGKAISGKIIEYIKTGKLKYFEELKKEIPEDLLKMLKIPGLGPKKVSAIYKNLNIKTIDKLADAARNKKLRDLEGFGEITELNILRGINLMKKTTGRSLLNVADFDGNHYIKYLEKCKHIKKLSLAGSLRRRKDTIGDIDILVSSDEPNLVMDFFVKYSNVQRVLLKGATKTSVILDDNIQVDLRVVEPRSFGSALQYFTGSKEHNVKIRGIAIKKGYKLNEYGLFDKKTEEYIVGKDETEIYKKLGLQYIEPELRENRGEFKYAVKNKLPVLLKKDDICGDLHVHSDYSDGYEKIEDIADNAKKLGYEYIGIADHSQSLKIARGLSEERINKKMKHIERINNKIKDLKVFCGTECDIKKDGILDYPDKVLKKLDYVGIGIHTNFKMTEEQATKRIIKGIENPYVTFLAHPTCRMIGRREAFELDIEQIFDAAKDNNVYLEINSFPDRLDLNDLHVKQGKDHGNSFVINTDSHSLEHMEFMCFGVSVARRGWLEKKDVLNTRSLTELEKIIGG